MERLEAGYLARAWLTAVLLASSFASLGGQTVNGRFPPSQGRHLLSDVVAAGNQRPPPLFDVENMPSPTKTCSHCQTDDLLFCCGVCVFRNNTCASLYPAMDVSSRVLRDVQKAGYALDGFKPGELYQRIRGRTLWFLGDSQAWELYLAAECFLNYYAITYQRSNVTDDPVLREALTLQRDAGSKRYPICLQLLGSTRICVIRLNLASEATEVVFPTLRRLGNMKRDIMVWNFGLHLDPTEAAYVPELQLAVKYIADHQRWLPKLVWMDTAPIHYNLSTPLGERLATSDVEQRGRNPPCVKLPNSTLIQQGGPYNIIARKFVKRLGVAHLQIWDATVPLWYAHNGGGDCRHYCHPGAYQLWVYLLNQVMQVAGLGNGT